MLLHHSTRIKHFQSKWSDINFPDTPIKLLNYNSDKIEIINNINKDCLN